MFSVFVLSWCPYFVFNLMDVYTDTSAKSMTHYAVTALIQSLAPLNSAANPIIYGLFGTRIFNGLRYCLQLSLENAMYTNSLPTPHCVCWSILKHWYSYYYLSLLRYQTFLGTGGQYKYVPRYTASKTYLFADYEQ